MLGRYNLLAKDHYVLDKTKYITTDLITSKEINGLRRRPEYIDHQFVGINHRT